MRIGTTQARFFAGGPTSEWSDISYLQPAKSGTRATLATFLVLWIAIVDLFWEGTTVAILYIAPLVLMAQTGALQRYWRTVSPMVLLTFGVYTLKYLIYRKPTDPGFIDIPFYNRALVAVTLLAMGKVLQLWVTWRAEQSEPEIPASSRYQDQQISSTFALLSCAPLVAVIAVVDYLSPANLNLAILYPIPLFICGWTRSRRLLWGILFLLLALTFFGFWFGAPATSANVGFAMHRNRILVALVLLTVTTILLYWLSREEVDAT